MSIWTTTLPTTSHYIWCARRRENGDWYEPYLILTSDCRSKEQQAKLGWFIFCSVKNTPPSFDEVGIWIKTIGTEVRYMWLAWRIKGVHLTTHDACSWSEPSLLERTADEHFRLMGQGISDVPTQSIERLMQAASQDKVVFSPIVAPPTPT